MLQVPQIFREISIQVLDMIPKTCDFVFSTDMYKKESIKAKWSGNGEEPVIRSL